MERNGVVMTGTLATLADVAARAGVSTATVSRCLNTPERVKAGTREKVLEAVHTLGYAPNFNARALVARQTRIIGAIIPTMDNAIFAAGLQTFQEVLAEAGYTLLVASSSYKKELEEAQIHNLISRGADALLLIGVDRSARIYDFLKHRKIPYVLAWNYKEDKQHSFVGFDNAQAAERIAIEVMRARHRKVAIISGITAENDRARARLYGFKARLRLGSEGPLDPDLLVECPYDIKKAGEAFDRLLASGKTFTALLCGNDVLAVGAMLRAKALGFELPGQLSVTGFDDLELSRIISPALTTIHVPHRKMGSMAAKNLLAQLEGKPVRNCRLQPYLIKRESLRPLL